MRIVLPTYDVTIRVPERYQVLDLTRIRARLSLGKPRESEGEKKRGKEIEDTHLSSDQVT